MLSYKVGATLRVPVILTDATTGGPFNSAVYSGVSVSYIKADGTTGDLTLGPTDFGQITATAYASNGYYNLTIPNTVTNLEGIFQYCVSGTGFNPYFGVLELRANTEKDIYDRIGAPVGASISADIQNVGVTAGSGGFTSGDRTNLDNIAAALPLAAARIASQPDVTGAVSSLETWMGTNTFNSSDRSNLNAIKAKTDNLPADPTGTSNLETWINTNVIGPINTVSGYVSNIKGTGWNSTNDTLHNLQLELAAVKAKTDNLPADPASMTELQTNIEGTGFSNATDSLHQLQLAITGIVGGSGGFTPTDRANLNAIYAQLPASAAIIASQTDVTSARDTVMGTDTTNSPYNVKRTISETYVYVRNTVAAKTNYLPNATVASQSDVNSARDYLAGTGYNSTNDNLHQISANVTTNNFGSTDRTTLNAIKTELDTVKTTTDTILTDAVGIKTKTDNLPADPASESGLVNSLGGTGFLSATDSLHNISAEIASFTGSGGGGFTSLDRADLAAVKSKTDNLPADPAGQSALQTWMATNTFNATDRSTLTLVRNKTDLLPADPASNTAITNARNAIMGTGSKDLTMVDTDVNAIYARLGAPAGLSHAADIAAVKSDTGTIRAALPGGTLAAQAAVAAIPTNPLLTNDARLPATVIAAKADIPAQAGLTNPEHDQLMAALRNDDARLPATGQKIASQADVQDVGDTVLATS